MKFSEPANIANRNTRKVLDKSVEWNSQKNVKVKPYPWIYLQFSLSTVLYNNIYNNVETLNSGEISFSNIYYGYCQTNCC